MRTRAKLGGGIKKRKERRLGSSCHNKGHQGGEKQIILRSFSVCGIIFFFSAFSGDLKHKPELLFKVLRTSMENDSPFLFNFTCMLDVLQIRTLKLSWAPTSCCSKILRSQMTHFSTFQNVFVQGLYLFFHMSNPTDS